MNKYEPTVNLEDKEIGDLVEVRGEFGEFDSSLFSQSEEEFVYFNLKRDLYADFIYGEFKDPRLNEIIKHWKQLNNTSPFDDNLKAIVQGKVILNPGDYRADRRKVVAIHNLQFTCNNQPVDLYAILDKIKAKG